MYYTEIETALVLKLSDISIPVKTSGSSILVSVAMGVPDKENITTNGARYPSITIQSLTPEPDLERESHDLRGIVTKGSTGHKAKKRSMALAYDLIYQINAFSMKQEHDRYLMTEIIRRFPKHGFLTVLFGDDTSGFKQDLHVFLDEQRNLDNVKEAKLYHKAFTIRVKSALDDADMQEVDTDVTNVITVVQRT